MLAACSRPELEMLIKEFVLGRPHPSTAHAEKCKLNVVLYMMRDARSVSMHHAVSMHQLLKRILPLLPQFGFGYGVVD